MVDNPPLHSSTFGFCVLWLTMLLPDETPLPVYLFAGIILTATISLHVFRFRGDWRGFLRRSAWISLLATATAFAAIEQMLHYPLIRGIEDSAPFWENETWARAGALIGFPIGMLSWHLMGVGGEKGLIFTLSSIAWSAVLGLATMGMLVVLRQVWIARRQHAP